MSEPRYAPFPGAGQECLDCGVAVTNKETHTRFHSILSSHAWALAVLKNSHISAYAHDKYNAAERIDSRKFGNWSADALAEVAAALDAQE